MAATNPKFNDWALSNAGFVASGVSFNFQSPARGEKAAITDGGMAAEGTLGPLTIKLSGTISAATNALARDAWGSLLKNLRGSDRVKKGRLDIYGDSHYWCQLANATPLNLVGGEGNVAVTFEFVADEPYRRANTLVSYSEAMSLSDSTMVLTYGSAFNGDAPRIPIAIKPSPNLAWSQGDLIRVYNVTAGWRFEHVVTQALSIGQPIILDGELCEVLENGSPVNDGNSGTAPYLKGGVSNTLLFSGTTPGKLAGNWTVEFYDRFMG